MAVQIGTRPDSGFDDPLGMLRDCHRRIEKFLRILCDVAERRELGPLTAEEVSAVSAALRYFADGGQRHNQDEEGSLFPRLRRADAADRHVIDRLESDHRDADELHGSVALLFSVWISGESLNTQDRRSLISATERLRALYAEHLRGRKTSYSRMLQRSWIQNCW